jgi:hypothetical protein
MATSGLMAFQAESVVILLLKPASMFNDHVFHLECSKTSNNICKPNLNMILEYFGCCTVDIFDLELSKIECSINC